MALGPLSLPPRNAGPAEKPLNGCSRPVVSSPLAGGCLRPSTRHSSSTTNPFNGK